METQQFINNYLDPDDLSERDLQIHLKRLLSKGTIGLTVREEVKIPTPAATRRSDLETWLTRYEVKLFLSYDNLYHAYGQVCLYGRFGSRILGVIPKRKAIVGLLPIDPNYHAPARKLAEDIRATGVEVVFVNEDSRFCKESHKSPANWLKEFGIAAAIGLVLVIGMSALPERQTTPQSRSAPINTSK